jgi:hypothetical protein
VKYNAKAGRWYVKGDDGEVEVQNPTFVADFANIKTGWFYFAAGAAPEKVFDPSLTQRADRPNKTYVDKTTGKTIECFKRGFQVNLFSKSAFDGVVELSGTAAALASKINDLYTIYDLSKEKEQGLLPVIEVKGANPETGKNGTNYSPIFSIVKWVPRPAEFDQAPAHNAAPALPASAPKAASVSEF